MTTLEVSNLTVALGERIIVEDVSLAVEQGEMVALIGPNGAGKTTLLKAALGLLPARAGTVRFFGKPLRELGEDRRRLGYVPQRLDLDRAIPITVQEYLTINTHRRYCRPEIFRKAFAEVDALRLLDRQMGALSGGELQRVLIALNLIHDPLLLLLDEPATGIDREGERRFYDILEYLCADRRMAVLMVSHDLSVVYRFASRVVCINRTLMCQGKPGDILNDETLEHLYGHATAVYGHEHS